MKTPAGHGQNVMPGVVQGAVQPITIIPNMNTVQQYMTNIKQVLGNHVKQNGFYKRILDSRALLKLYNNGH